MGARPAQSTEQGRKAWCECVGIPQKLASNDAADYWLSETTRARFAIGADYVLAENGRRSAVTADLRRLKHASLLPLSRRAEVCR